MIVAKIVAKNSAKNLAKSLRKPLNSVRSRASYVKNERGCADNFGIQASAFCQYFWRNGAEIPGIELEKRAGQRPPRFLLDSLAVVVV